MSTVEKLNKSSSLIGAFLDISRELPRTEIYRQAQASGPDGPLDEWRAATYAQVRERVLKIASYLKSLGVERGDKVGILSATRPEWMEADLAILALGGVVVSIYQSIPAVEIGYLLFDSSAEVVFAENNEQVEKLIALLDSPCSMPATEERPESKVQITLKKIITFEDTTPHPLVQSLGAVLAASKSDEEVVEQGLAREDLATLVYTSGTTGPPKGVMQTHGNHLANLRQVRESGVCTDENTIFLMLPLAHSFAKLMGYIGFLTPTMLFFPAVVDRKTSKLHAVSVMRDLRECGCEVLPIVPRLLEKMKEGIMHQARALSLTGLALRLTLWAARETYENDHAGILVKIAYQGTATIRQKIKSRLFGSNLIKCIAGGAKLNTDVAQFFDSLGIELCEGYGLTETCVATNVNPVGRKKIGSVGPCLTRDIELKIAPDGEILFRGPNVSKGYYNRSAATKAAWDSEGWFHTGDLGRLDAEGYLYITGRKKELIITSYGKNIAPEHVEQLLKKSPYISQAVLVGDDRAYCVAILTLDRNALEGWAKLKRVLLSEEAHRSTEVIKLVSAEVAKANATLSSYESVKKFIIAKDDFTVENGFLTPTFKVKRKKVAEAFREEIDSLYNSSETA